jgi:hypothetical protein
MRRRESGEGLKGDIDEMLGKKDRSDDLKETFSNSSMSPSSPSPDSLSLF